MLTRPMPSTIATAMIASGTTTWDMISAMALFNRPAATPLPVRQIKLEHSL
jgi:hypothetical protein